jgi:DNA-binding transcriptional MerR regulator
VEEIKKLYYSIGEVSRMTDLPASVLRFWETEFGGIRPPKNRAGKRTYRRSDIDRILLIKKLLYEDRFTIEGARKVLSELTAKSKSETQTTAPAALPLQDEIRRGLREILEILNG